MPNEQKRPQIKTRERVKILVERKARPVETEHARCAAAFPARALVLHAVTEIDADAPAGFPQTQAQIDVGLALPVPVIESIGGAKRFHVHQRATGMGRFHFDDPLTGRRDGRALKFLPQTQGLIAGGKNPRRHQWLLVTSLRSTEKISLTKIHPGPVSFLKLGVAASEIAGLKQNIGIDEQSIFCSDRAQRHVGRLAETVGLLISDQAHAAADWWQPAGPSRSVVDNDDFINGA